MTRAPRSIMIIHVWVLWQLAYVSVVPKIISTYIYTKHWPGLNFRIEWLKCVACVYATLLVQDSCRTRHSFKECDEENDGYLCYSHCGESWCFRWKYAATDYTSYFCIVPWRRSLPLYKRKANGKVDLQHGPRSETGNTARYARPCTIDDHHSSTAARRWELETIVRSQRCKRVFSRTLKYAKYFTLSVGVCWTATLPISMLRKHIQQAEIHELCSAPCDIESHFCRVGYMECSDPRINAL